MTETMRLDTGGWRIDVLMTGYPGKSVCHGSLGWSTVALLRGHGRVALVDTGGFGMRTTLLQRLAAHGLAPADVTDVLLTHSHYDHSVNFTMFVNARIVIGDAEMDWAVTVPWGQTTVPELYVEELRRRPGVVLAGDGDSVLQGVTAHLAPGHTPGCLVFHLAGAERDVIFTGDAAKNRAELVSGDTDMTYDAAVSRTSIEMVWRLWRARPGTVLIAGHDVPMVQEDGVTAYLGPREAAIRAWFGDGMDQTTLFELTA
jgi:glyoxylase-like metal-dependent hydrolase (beta-lactamase superfamily II)